ncbi:HD-GYP domain-containing protein [Solibacillus sp. MA9]|uniref:HD-GYP domain-containing protein n=1 Tax=Solibacillus palustris TaxID=2908203 RepID=A0ABS9UFA4_9BACL|nr:HD-GYP domain-containing protein [Solibacillus sp. MA9]MCH7323016.1 HD-GYP domain-containing protein [Solibacillus sp. MA9]
MRLISINVLKEGMVVGRTIWNEAGHPLLHKDVIVTNRIVERLRELKIQYLYIDDMISTGIEIEETVSPSKRIEAVKNMTKAFTDVKRAKASQASYVLDQQSKVLGLIVDDILNSIMNSSEVLMVLTDAYLYDEYIYQHSFQVTMYSLAIAKELGYSYEDVRLIGIGALLHDIGKLLIPSEILMKPGKLTDEEYEEMKQHARFGFDILRNLHSVSLLVAHCAFQHHERIDGSGYPRGIVDFEIHPFAKVIAVADVFDALTSNRVYRKKMLPIDAIAIIMEGRAKLFDARVVDAFLRSVVHYANGSIVLLSDGRRGIISKQNIVDVTRPWVRIFEEDDKLLDATYEICLSDHPLLNIEKIEVDYVVPAE